MKDIQHFSHACEHFTLRWDEEHEILFVKDIGYHDEVIAQEHQELVWSFFDSERKERKDLSQPGESDPVDPGTKNRAIPSDASP